MIQPSLSLVLAASLLGGPILAQDPPQQPRPSGGAAPSDDAFEMGSPDQLQQGLAEEDMWPAATAEGWKKPVLVHWQRTFEDAMRVAQTEEKPVMVVVNMDGEIASEHFAGVRYREADTAALMSRYACVMASVYRHTPRDYDETGQRVECPRFGTVTCGEHINAERELYEKYFDGKRISPRHLVLDLEGNETYDVYYSWDTQTVFTTFVKGVEGWPEPKEPEDRSLRGMLMSADVEDRQIVEKTYVTGTAEARRSILETLVEEREVDQIGVLRAAIFGLDLKLAKLARKALAECDTDDALDLMAEVLKTPLEDSEREMILAAVGRLGDGSKRARTLAALHSGLSTGSRHIAMTEADRAAEYEANVNRRIDVQAREEAARSRPAEPGALLELAEGMLVEAFAASDPRFASLLLEDARRTARRAEELGAKGPLMDAVFALTHGYGSRVDGRQYNQAQLRAVRAVEAGLLAEGDGQPKSDLLSGPGRTRLLLLFADARQRSIRRAYRAGDTWPPEWLSDVNAAYTSVADDPYITADRLGAYQDFLRWIGASERAKSVLAGALERFPESPELHERLRGQLLWEGGPKALEGAYTEACAELEQGDTTWTPQVTWFAGYASIVAAEHQRRRNEFDQAFDAYDRAQGHYARNIADYPEGRDSSLHFQALARAGQARLRLEAGQLEAATELLVSAIELRPDSAGTPDGLSLTPVQTGYMLQARLMDKGDMVRALRVQNLLDSLDRTVVNFPSAAKDAPRVPEGAQQQGASGQDR